MQKKKPFQFPVYLKVVLQLTARCINTHVCKPTTATCSWGQNEATESRAQTG